jgi:hypothetical protein
MDNSQNKLLTEVGPGTPMGAMPFEDTVVP